MSGLDDTVSSGGQIYVRLSQTTPDVRGVAGLGSYVSQVGARFDSDLSAPLNVVMQGFDYAVSASAAGSIVPGFGTVVGAAIGFVLGALSGLFSSPAVSSDPYADMNAYQKAAAQVPLPPLPCIEPKGGTAEDHLRAFISCATTAHDRLPRGQDAGLNAGPTDDWFWALYGHNAIAGIYPDQDMTPYIRNFSTYAGNTTAWTEYSRRLSRWVPLEFVGHGSPFYSTSDNNEAGWGEGPMSENPSAGLVSKLALIAAMHTKTHFANPTTGFPDAQGDRDALQFLLTWYWTWKANGGPDSPSAHYLIGHLESLTRGTTTSLMHAQGLATAVPGRFAMRAVASQAGGSVFSVAGQKYGPSARAPLSSNHPVVLGAGTLVLGVLAYKRFFS